MKADLKTSLLQSPNGKHWEQLGIRNHYGFVVPLFSLHTEKSCGIGEYPDLIPLLQWSKELGYDIIQLLPLNDSGSDSSPYSAITAFGLNPIHLGLSDLPHVEKYPELTKQIKALRAMRSYRVDYDALRLERESFLRGYFQLERDLVVNTPEFREFTKAHGWLNGYALFKTLKEIHHWKPHSEWPDEYQKLTPEAIDTLAERHREETLYHIFVQYFCFKQMHQVEEVAEKLGSYIFGDIPILLGRESTDVWQWPMCFRPEFNAGVPPDFFAKDGQNWGLPIYNWKAMASNDYAWWKKRLQVASLFYHIYRIDHILGFYRIWAIPQKLRGRKGFFIPDTPEEWVNQGETLLLMLINATSMFPTGEDLGFMDENISKSLKDTGIPGMKVPRWERNFDTDKSFIPMDSYTPSSITTISTHDMSSLGEWWTQEAESAKEFAKFLDLKYAAPLSEENRFKILHATNKSGSLFHINPLQEYLSLIPEFCLNAPEDERVNIPGTVTKSNWSIRYKPTLEEIMSNTKLNKLLKELIA